MRLFSRIRLRSIAWDGSLALQLDTTDSCFCLFLTGPFHAIIAKVMRATSHVGPVPSELP